MTEQNPKQIHREMVTPTKAPQGTGPSAMVTVLILSTVLAAAGTAFLAYFLA